MIIVNNIDGRHTFLFVLIFSLWSTQSFAEMWKLSLDKEIIKGKQEKSILNFKNSAGKSFIYKPLEEPYTFLKVKEVVLNKKVFLVTTWAYGARSVMIRIFDPQLPSTNPLCTAVSDSYDPQLRITKSYLEVDEVVSELHKKSVVRWKKCTSFANL